jgi:hypothetical protein
MALNLDHLLRTAATLEQGLLALEKTSPEDGVLFDLYRNGYLADVRALAGKLKEALQESRLPILVELHLWAHLPTAFHDEIERRYVVVQEGSST